MAPAPDGASSSPVVQRLRLRYAKRERLRFASHRDFSRAFERALRRAQLPVAFSAGFSPHPRVSYVGAAPTGASSEAEYLELALAERREPVAVAVALHGALPSGFDVLEVVEARSGSLPERIDAGEWELRLPGADRAALDAAVGTFLAAREVPVERLTKDGRRRLDARAAVIDLTVTQPSAVGVGSGCAILRLVVRHGTPTVRPDDVLAGLAVVAGFAPPSPPLVTRLAQGRFDARTGRLADPLAPDRLVGEVVGA